MSIEATIRSWSGAERLREVLRQGTDAATCDKCAECRENGRKIVAALDGCVLLTAEEQATGVWLTAEEAERVRGLLESGQQTEREEYSTGAAYDAAISAEYEPILALFTPEER